MEGNAPGEITVADSAKVIMSITTSLVLLKHVNLKIKNKNKTCGSI